MNHGNRRFEVLNLRIRNATQSEDASRSARVSKHQIRVKLLLSAGVFALATRSCLIEVRIWRNAQCGAVSRRMIFNSRCHARNNHRPRLRAFQIRDQRHHSRRCVLFAEKWLRDASMRSVSPSNSTSLHRTPPERVLRAHSRRSSAALGDFGEK